MMTREQAWELLKQYNQEPFHLRHAVTVEGVMRWFAGQLGYGDESDFWANAGLLHDLDYEQYPDEHLFRISFHAEFSPGRTLEMPLSSQCDIYRVDRRF